MLMTISSDFAGLGGQVLSTVGTVYLASEVGKTIRSFSKNQKKQYKKSSSPKKSKKSRYYYGEFKI